LGSDQQLLAWGVAKKAGGKQVSVLFTVNFSASLVFPIAGLAFTYPSDGGSQALSSGLLAPGPGDPLDVFSFMAVAEIFERGQRRLALFQSSK
jgi:hypothetical protein